MAISLERFCAAAHSSLSSPLPKSPSAAAFRGSSFRSTSFRFLPASSRSRHDSKRRAAIEMQFEASDGKPPERSQSKVRDDETVSNSQEVDPSVTKCDDNGVQGSSQGVYGPEAKMASLPTPLPSSDSTHSLLGVLAWMMMTRPTMAARERNMPLQLRIPCLLMRGGTSRGTYFLKQHLPHEKEALDKVLLRVMGSPDRRQIDGVGGASSVTSKVAVLSASGEPGVDVDYTFAEVLINRSYVDWEPTCGNLLAGVGPAAIEMGLVNEIGSPFTPVRIRATNNGALVEAVVQTPDYSVTYDGDAAIDGVPGTAAPITLNFMDVVGSKAGGRLLPTGQLRDLIDEVQVTCIDVAMPLVIAKASSFGKTGYETTEELDEDGEFFRKMEAIRVIAGRKMGLGDVSGRVIPKFAIVSEPRDKEMGNITARYFVPFKTHSSMAVTGAICIGCCSILRGSVADEVSTKTSIGRNKNRVAIEHPSGRIQIFLDSEQKEGTSNMLVNRAGVMRTARLIFEGSVHVRTEGLEDDFRPHQSLEGLERYRHYHHQLQQDFRKLYRFRGSDKDLESEWQGDELTDMPEDELQPFVKAALST